MARKTTAKPAAPSALDMLNKLKASAKPTEPKASGKERKVIELQGPAADAFAALLGCKQIEDKVKARKEGLDDQVKAECFDLFTEIMWQAKGKVDNPEIVVYREDGRTVDHRGIYQIKAIFRLTEFAKADDPKGAILEALTAGDDDDLGRLSMEDALALVNAEIVSEPQIGIKRGLSELLNGHFENNQWFDATEQEKAVGMKLLAMLTTEPDGDGKITVDGFTEDERSLLVSTKPLTKVKDPKMFLGRVCQYAKNRHQLRRVLTAIKPDFAISGLKFASADNDTVRHDRLMTFADEVLGRAS